jgi:hypothetical protein
MREGRHKTPLSLTSHSKEKEEKKKKKRKKRQSDVCVSFF